MKGAVIKSSGPSSETGAIMTSGNETWHGGWVAALFGNPEPDATGADRLPGSVAGTFGVRRTSDAFVGAFVAHRTAWTDAP